jgi:hypothetical protein
MSNKKRRSLLQPNIVRDTSSYEFDLATTTNKPDEAEPEPEQEQEPEPETKQANEPEQDNQSETNLKEATSIEQKHEINENENDDSFDPFSNYHPSKSGQIELSPPITISTAPILNKPKLKRPTKEKTNKIQQKSIPKPKPVRVQKSKPPKTKNNSNSNNKRGRPSKPTSNSIQDIIEISDDEVTSDIEFRPPIDEINDNKNKIQENKYVDVDNDGGFYAGFSDRELRQRKKRKPNQQSIYVYDQIE